MSIAQAGNRRVDERARLRRQPALPDPDQMHGRRWSLERLEHHLHSSSAQVPDHLIGHCAEQPRAGKFGVDRPIEGIYPRPGAKWDPPFGPVGFKKSK